MDVTVSESGDPPRGYLRETWKEHRRILVILLIYVAAGSIVLAAVGRNGFARFFPRFNVFALWSSIYLGLLLAWGGVRHLARIIAGVIERSTGIARVGESPHVPLLSGRQIAGFMVVMVLSIFLLSIFSNLKQAIPLINPFHWDRVLMEIDYHLHGGAHPWELLHPIIGYPRVTKMLDYAYVSWFGFLYFFLTGFGLSSRGRLRSRYFISFILTWIIAGSLFAVLLSSSGPCYFGKIHPGENPFLPLMEYLRSIHDDRFLYAVKFQDGLWSAHAAGENLTFGGVSAMPSVHVATAALFACAAWSIHRMLGYAFIAYTALIQVGSVHLGWHYAVDGYFGILIAIAVWRLSGRVCPADF